MNQRTTTRRGANHGLHAALTLMTCGVWAITGWPIAAALGRRTTVTTHQTPLPGGCPHGVFWYHCAHCSTPAYNPYKEGP
jgi:hypothetical protein